MSTDVKWVIVVVLVAFVFVRAFFRWKTKKNERQEVDDPLMSIEPVTTEKIRLTELQQIALQSASFAPIHVEMSRYESSSIGQEHYSRRTVESLVKRGFLEFDGVGGYAITPAGLIAIGWE